MSMKCPSCGYHNRPQATWCERCKKGLTLGGRMAEPWGKTGIASRVSTTWALFTGSGCLLLFLFPPLGLFLLILSVMSQFLWKKAIPGVCPHCGQDTGTIHQEGLPSEFPCVHCGKLIVIDRTSGKPKFVKATNFFGERAPSALQGPPDGQQGDERDRRH